MSINLGHEGEIPEAWRGYEDEYRSLTSLNGRYKALLEPANDVQTFEHLEPTFESKQGGDTPQSTSVRVGRVRLLPMGQVTQERRVTDYLVKNPYYFRHLGIEFHIGPSRWFYSLGERAVTEQSYPIPDGLFDRDSRKDKIVILKSEGGALIETLLDDEIMGKQIELNSVFVPENQVRNHPLLQRVLYYRPQKRFWVGRGR